MHHLTDETLARLADDEASAAEAHHLRECAVCRERLTAYRADLAILHTLPAMAPPVEEFVLSRRAASARPERRVLGVLAGLAAAGLIFFAGLAAGRRVRPAPTTPLGLAMYEPPSVTAATARLAALEVALLTTREAARAAPQDPTLIAYERVTTMARDSLLRLVKLTSGKHWY